MHIKTQIQLICIYKKTKFFVDWLQSLKTLLNLMMPHLQVAYNITLRRNINRKRQLYFSVISIFYKLHLVKTTFREQKKILGRTNVRTNKGNT